MKKGIEVHRWSKKTECKKEILILYHNSWKLSPDQGISHLTHPWLGETQWKEFHLFWKHSFTPYSKSFATKFCNYEKATW